MSDSEKPCTCGNPILRWVHNAPPFPCGQVAPTGLKKTIEEIRAGIVARLDSFIGKKTAPDTVEAVREQMRSFFKEQGIELDEHFDVVPVGKDDIDIRAKTPWASEFLSKAKEEERDTLVETIPVLQAKMDAALRVAIGIYRGKKNTPFTRFQIAQRLRPLLAVALNQTDKELGRHFDIAVTPKGIDVIPKTDWAKALLPATR